MSIRDLLLGKSDKGEQSSTGDFNMVKLVGLAEVVVEDRALILTQNMTADGKTYQERHVIRLTPEMNVQEGKRYALVGKFINLDTEDGNRETVIEVNTIVKAKKSDMDMNLAKVVGRAATSFQYFPRTESGKVAFGNLLMVTGPEDKPTFHKSVAFGNLANRLDRAAKRNSIVQIVGPIRYREFEQDGVNRTATEIIAQPDLTKVLKAAKVEDPFAGMESEAAAEPAI